MPLPAIAFVLAMMQSCLEEWNSGSFKTQDLHAPTQEPIFDAHLKGLLVYKNEAAGRMHHFQEQWFKVGMSYAGITVNDWEEPEYCQPITRASDIRPNTPDHYHLRSNSPTPEVDSQGRYTTKSKGKKRQVQVQEDSDSEPE